MMNAAVPQEGFSGFSIRVFVLEIAEALESADLATILQQIHYWLENPRSGKWHNGRKWTYNTYEEWQEQFPWLSVHMVGRLIRQLERLGLVVSANLNRTYLYRRKWYTLDYQKIFELTGWNPKGITVKSNESIDCADLHDPSHETATPLLNSLKITSLIQQHSDSDSHSEPNCCFPPPPESQTIAPAPPCQEPLRSPLPSGRSALDTEPPLALKRDDHKGEGEELEMRKRHQNADASEILSAVRAVLPLNRQIQAEVLKYTLSEVQAAIVLYRNRNRNQKTPIRNVGGWLTDALRGRWASFGANSAKATKAHENQYPPELVRWYNWATAQGIVCCDIPLHLCLTHSLGTPAGLGQGYERTHTLVPVMLPPVNRRLGSAPYEYIPWREAMTRFPMPEGAGSP
jgi:hypothetical protein